MTQPPGMPSASPVAGRAAAGRSGAGIPAYEDIHYYLWKEYRLPANVLAEDAKLRDPLERARLAKVFGQGLASVAGSVLPLRRVIDGGARRWQSGKWFFKAGEMFLVPGDSPVGLRLPLESLPWVDPEQAEYDVEPDPFAPRERLPPRQALQSRRALGPNSSIENFRPVPQELPVIGRSDPSVVRTALWRSRRARVAARVLPAGVRGRGLAGADRGGRGNRAGRPGGKWSWKAICRRRTTGCCISR